MATVAPYGAWQSPITAAALVAGERTLGNARFVGDEIWWTEVLAAEAGRYAIRRHGPHGAVADVLPAPWNARSRVHEYGGGAWVVTGSAALVFVEFTDQRIYRLDEPGGTPVALTPDGGSPPTWHHGALQLVGDEVWAVRETHTDGSVERDIVAVPLDARAADDAAAVRSVVGGSHFLACPSVSPDGRHLAWIAWEHPQMPWDGTELRVGELVDGVCPTWRVLLGSTTESVLQPEWAGDDALWVISDRSGFWNLYRIAAAGGEPLALCPTDAEFGGPMWQLGAGWYRPLPDGTLLTVRTFGTDTVAVLDPADGTLRDIDLGDNTSVSLGPVAGDRALLSTAGAHTPAGVRLLELGTGRLTDIRRAVEELPDAALLPHGEAVTFGAEGSGREVHAIVYAPRNPDFAGPDDELPPYVAWVHGGPTSMRQPRLSLAIAYFTSRGIGIVDVNYGGSTGYGREYRDRLRGQWGVVDVEDTVTAVRALADAGRADPARLAIQGGSAGGWTVLAALTGTDAFACGTSYFGVAELIMFAAETHDFESRYLDGLIGPLPEARELYETRAPVNNVAGLSCPVLLLQGLDDPIVPPSQAERFRDAMVAKGLPHAYRAYEGESHGFRRAETIIDATEAELSFYGQIMGFDPPDVPRLELWRPPTTG